MPPSREFKIRVNEEVQRELEAALGIKAHYRTKVVSSKNNKTFGEHHHAQRLIVVYTGHDLFANSSLRAVHTEILHTFLHEFRHAHQRDHWTPERIEQDRRRPYHLREMEEDANKWAAAHITRWRGLFQIRPVSGNNLSRLSLVTKGR